MTTILCGIINFDLKYDPYYTFISLRRSFINHKIIDVLVNQNRKYYNSEINLDIFSRSQNATRYEMTFLFKYLVIKSTPTEIIVAASATNTIL